MEFTGQAELLMKERFSQFSGLIDDCEFNRGEKTITCQDLQGFWDIVDFQVSNGHHYFCYQMISYLFDLVTGNFS